MTIPKQNELIQHQQLNEIVAERLREAILTGKLKPGEFIRQNHIAKEYGVSPIPVREALMDLVSESLVEHIPYRGVRVIKYTVNDVADIFALRSFLEGRAAAATAESVSVETIEKLTELAEQMKVLFTANNMSLYREVNQQFHKLIYLSSKRVYLIQNLDKIWLSSPTMIQGNFPQSQVQLYQDLDRRDYLEHLEIIKALANHDSVAAEAVMKKHIYQAGQDLLSNLTSTKEVIEQGN
jgi:DNA-binding GntR family transcriptional regulator